MQSEKRKGHTPGPLYLDRGSSVSPLCARVTPHSDGFIVASFNREEDARRMVVLWNICDGIRTEVFRPGVIGALTSALREMLKYAEARNADKRARTVHLKFSRLTLEMWMEKARAALSKAETLVPAADPSFAKLELALLPPARRGTPSHIRHPFGAARLPLPSLQGYDYPAPRYKR